jgi:hypothetical protein
MFPFFYQDLKCGADITPYFKVVDYIIMLCDFFEADSKRQDQASQQASQVPEQ